MKILVAVKQVAALDEDFTIREDGRDVDADFLIRDLNEWDDFSLEEAVKIKEAASEPVEVIAFSVGPEEVDESLRKCLAKGADRAVRVWDDAIEGSDSIAIARVLAAVAKREAPAMLFAGVSREIRHVHFVVLLLIVRDTAGMKLKRSACQFVFNDSGNLGCCPVPVDFPVGPHVAEKTPLLLLGERLPNLPNQRPQTVEHTLPLDSLLLALPHLLAYQT